MHSVYSYVLSVKSGNCYCIDVLDEADAAFISDIGSVKDDLVLNRPRDVKEVTLKILCDFLLVVSAKYERISVVVVRLDLFVDLEAVCLE